MFFAHAATAQREVVVGCTSTGGAGRVLLQSESSVQGGVWKSAVISVRKHTHIMPDRVVALGIVATAAAAAMYLVYARAASKARATEQGLRRQLDHEKEAHKGAAGSDGAPWRQPWPQARGNAVARKYPAGR